VKGPLSPHLRPQHLRSEREISSVETVPQEHRKEKVQKERRWRGRQSRKKRTWLGLVLLIGPALAALYAAYIDVPTYRAEATLLIDSPQRDDQTVDRIGRGSTTNGDKTQYELLKSHSLVSRVIREQGLGLVSGSGAANEQMHQQQAVTSNAGDNVADVKPRAVAGYLANLDIVPIPETRLVKVAYHAATPQLAARIANAHVETYIRQNQEQSQTTQDETASLTVVDKAIPPVQPVRSPTYFVLLTGGLLGLVLGGGLLYGSRQSSTTVRTPADVDRYLKLASLGVVPDFASEAMRGEGAMPVPPQFESMPGVFSKELLLAYHPLSLIPEAYRNLRAEILLSRPAGPPRSLLVASAMSGEGKTVTALNTAIALSQMGARVLLVDADLRHPHCHAVLKMAKGLGLTEFLTGQCDLAEVIQTTRVDRLFFISGGACPPNPAELLGAKKMQAALAFLKHLYDYIVIDSPPLGLVSEGLLLSQRVDGVMLVVNSQTTHYKVVQEAVARLQRVRAKMLGVVLNRVDARSREYAEYGRRYRAYYRQPNVQDVPEVQEEPVSTIDPKKRSKKASHGRTSSGKASRKSSPKIAGTADARLLGVAVNGVSTASTTATAVAADERHKSPTPEVRVDNTTETEQRDSNAKDVGAEMVSTPTPIVGTAEREELVQRNDHKPIPVAERMVDDSDDAFPLLEGDIDESRVGEAHIDESQRDRIVTADLDRAQPS
jgi:capsular exopolysaccharide synthesis family protein